MKTCACIRRHNAHFTTNSVQEEQTHAIAWTTLQKPFMVSQYSTPTLATVEAAHSLDTRKTCAWIRRHHAEFANDEAQRNILSSTRSVQA